MRRHEALREIHERCVVHRMPACTRFPHQFDAFQDLAGVADHRDVVFDNVPLLVGEQWTITSEKSGMWMSWPSRKVTYGVFTTDSPTFSPFTEAPVRRTQQTNVFAPVALGDRARCGIRRIGRALVDDGDVDRIDPSLRKHRIQRFFDAARRCRRNDDREQPDLRTIHGCTHLGT